MIEIKVPKEIKEYKEKWYFGLTLRQLISVGISISLNIPLVYFGKKYLSTDLLGWLCILITIIFGGIGFFEYNKMKFEKFVIVYLKNKFQQQKRVYKSTNIFDLLNK